MRRLQEYMERGGAGPWLVASLLLVLWEVLLRAENPGLMADDSGETVAAAAGLGISHPPGYPLYNLVGRIASIVPLGTPAFRLNLLAGLFTLLALVFIAATSREIFRSLVPLSSAWSSAGLTVVVMVSTFACQGLFSHSLTAKGGVYTLTLLFLSVFLWWRVRNETAGHRDRMAPTLGILFLWSLGLANHWETQILWIPFLVQWFWRKQAPFVLKPWLIGAAFILIGCSVYLSIPMRARYQPMLDWGHAVNLKQFLWVLMRGPYTGIEAESRAWSTYLGKGMEVLRSVSWHWWPGWILLSIAGCVFLMRRNRSLAVGLLLLYLPVVAAILIVPNLSTETFNLVHPYLVSTQGVLALFGSAGIGAIFVILARAPGWTKAVLLALLMTVGTTWMVRTFTREAKTDYAYSDDFTLNVLKGLPRGSLLLSEGDQFVMPLFYYQAVLGKRRDVVHVPAVFINSKWGYERAMEDLKSRVRNEFAIPEPKARLRFLLMASRTLEDPASMPTYYSLNRGLLDSFALGLDDQLDPAGLVFERVNGKAPSPREVATSVWKTAQQQRMRNFRTLKRKDQVDPSTAEFYRYYANQYVVAGNTLNQSGMLSDALEYYLKAIGIYPFTAEAYSNMAVLFGKEGYLEMAQVLCSIAIDKDPQYAGAYDNLGNVFSLMGVYSMAVDAYQKSLTLKPGEPNTLLNLQRAEAQVRNKAPMPAWTKRPSTYYFTMGNQSAEEDRLLMAEIAYRTAESVGYTYPDLYNNMGVILAQQGRYDEAESAFLRSIDRNGRFVEAYKNYGLLLLNQERWKEARRIIGKGLTLAPDNPELQYLKSRLEPS